jgi:hypothetical protein
MLTIFTGSIVTTVAIVIALAISLQKQVNAKGGCPECGTPVPTFRNPSSIRQALWGGWTCSICHTEMDRHGNRQMAPVSE